MADVVPLVLLHDSLGRVELWRDLPERLALSTGRPVFAYDRLGFGRSDPHPDVLGMDFIRSEARECFRAVRAAAGLEKFVAFGHSVGGGMAVGIAATYPVQSESMITIFRAERSISPPSIEPSKATTRRDRKRWGGSFIGHCADLSEAGMIALPIPRHWSCREHKGHPPS